MNMDYRGLLEMARREAANEASKLYRRETNGWRVEFRRLTLKKYVDRISPITYNEVVAAYEDGAA